MPCAAWCARHPPLCAWPHTVATGNMTPSYRVVDGQVRPLYFYSVDISEFAVNKLLDRGSLTVKTIVTNVQDFIIQVRRGVCS